ncbi:MAG: hypothetical protein Q8R13_02525 [bacterium]|nr:hypothetical protein [bacterium]
MSFDPIDRPGIYLTPVWEDEDLFEVEVCATDGRFAGIARCYTTREQIAELARTVDRFPKSTSDLLRFSTDTGGKFSSFDLHFRCIDGRGGVVVRVKVAERVHYSNAPGIDNVVEFDLGVEPASIDNFSSQLAAMAQAKIGEKRAVLHGKT